MSVPRTTTIAPSPRVLSYELLHDLRTPLNQIVGYSEMLIEQAEEDGQAGFTEDLRKIRAAGHLLTGLLAGSAPAARKSTPQNRAAPVTQRSPPARIDSGVAETSAHRGAVLVVDDDAVNRDLLSRRVTRLGCDAVTAPGGREALATVRVTSFDLVLLDVMMPEVDGYEVLREMKSDSALRHIPVIMISALDDMESVVRCVEMGAEDYLFKPFSPTLLKARIDTCLDKKHSRDRDVRLHAQLEQNYERLRELEKQRDDLTSMIVHDLRIPLTSIISGIQTLQAMGGLDETQSEVTGIALAGGETLLGMIGDLLDVNKMESGAMSLDCETLDAADLVNAAVSQVTALAANGEIKLITKVPAHLPPLHGDVAKLRRVLVNLLGNAIKFTPPGGTVTVTVRRPASGGRVRFTVSDTGEGIPRASFGRIFEKFGQLESRTGGRHMSTGLGLTFCKLVVEAHGGEIGVQSKPGHGSQFRFSVPSDRAQQTS